MKTLRRVILAEENRLRRQADAAITQAARTEYGSKPKPTTAAEENAQEKQTIRHNAGSDIATSRIRSRIYGRGLARSMARGRLGPRVTSAESLRLGRLHGDNRRAAQARAAQAVVSHTVQPLTAGRVFMFEAEIKAKPGEAPGTARQRAGLTRFRATPGSTPKQREELHTRAVDNRESRKERAREAARKAARAARQADADREAREAAIQQAASDRETRRIIQTSPEILRRARSNP